MLIVGGVLEVADNNNKYIYENHDVDGIFRLHKSMYTKEEPMNPQTYDWCVVQGLQLDQPAFHSLVLPLDLYFNL